MYSVMIINLDSFIIRTAVDLDLLHILPDVVVLLHQVLVHPVLHLQHIILKTLAWM